ncbi:MAG: hypothetical protein AAFQ98_25555, partial [Bacteroidota bacterium]
MKNYTTLLRFSLVLVALLGFCLPKAQAQSPGLRDVTLTDDCSGTVQMKFLYYRDAWAGIRCAAINYNRKLDDAHIFAIVGGTRYNLARIDWAGSSGGNYWADDQVSCKGGGIRFYHESGYSFTNHSKNREGGGCWSGASNCKAMYVTVTFRIPQFMFGRTINFGMDGKWDGGNFSNQNHFISMPAIPTPSGMRTTSECDQVRLDWSLPTKNCGSATQYQIRRNGTTIIASGLSQSTDSYTDSRPVHDEYEYEIRAKHSASAGTFYSPWQTIVRGSPRKPVETPANVRVDQDNCEDTESNLALNLEWTVDATNLPSEFKVYRSTGSTFSESLPNTTVNRDRSWFVDDGSQLGALEFDRTY